MSIESAKAFLAKMKTDGEFAKKVTGCKDAAERRTLVKQAGFEFTNGEIKQVGGELSDSELDAVAGGGCLWEGCADTCGLSEVW
ncbi:MAG: Nif11-like leader peptide family natural product precursor [Eubacteriales bacterium]